ncbi:AAA family ATPase [Micromonospora sp. NPDC050200]|uniref:helix-turn-helix transcriptional regulator n=1 Tax=Micromonospora sp. NPDC050200 TaxID=3155664 RepID=UPI0034097E3E
MTNVARESNRKPGGGSSRMTVGAGGPNAERLGRPISRVTAPRLVGRHPELDQLTSALGAPPSVVIIEGEAGIGKTRLLAEVLPGLDEGGRRVVVGGCRQIREPFPLGPVVEAVRGVGAGLAGKPLSPVVGALRPLLPELSDVLPAMVPPLNDRRAEQHRVFRGLVELLDSLGSVVMVLEDLQWADESTVDFVSYLFGDVHPKLSVVLTFRGDEVHPAVRAVSATLPAMVGRAHITLSPFGEGQAGELAAEILGLDRVSDEFAAYLCERASGIPFAIEELLALLRSRGTLMLQGGGWARQTIDELDVPRGIRDQVSERVSRLSRDGKAVVEAAAVLQVAAPLTAILETTPTVARSALRGIDEAVEAGLLVVRDGTIGFRHVLAAQATYEDLPEARRRELHARGAHALRSLPRVPLGLVAHHLHHAGRIDEWVGAAERAADQAIELGHDDEAVRLLRSLLDNAPPDAERHGRIAVKLARAAVETLQAQDAIGLLAEVLDRDNPPPESRGELRLRLALLVNIAGGDPAFQRRLYLDALADLDSRPDLKAWAMTGLAMPTVPGLALAEQKDWLHRALEVIPRVADDTFEVFLLGKVAMVLAPTGDPAWRGVADRIIQRSNGSPGKRQEMNACYSAGLAACYVGDHDIANRLLSRALSGAIAGESHQLAARARAAAALSDFCRGTWDGLAERADRLLDEYPDHAVIRANVEVVRGCLALAAGRLDDAQALLTAAVSLTERAGAFDLLPIPLSALVRLLIARRRADNARTRIDRYFAAVEPIGVWAPVARVLPPAVDALVACGEADGAHQLVDRWAARLGGLDSPLAAAALSHARGLLHEAHHRWRRAARDLTRAAHAYDTRNCPYEAAQARERAASVLLAAGDPSAAEHLRAALATYRRLGATWDLGRAARTARWHGLAPPGRNGPGRRGYGNQLSPREREVAELAATGRTNKEIGAELFLSVSTVEKHLGAVSRKLGVHSRSAIARWVSEHPAS